MLAAFIVILGEDVSSSFVMFPFMWRKLTRGVTWPFPPLSVRRWLSLEEETECISLLGLLLFTTLGLQVSHIHYLQRYVFYYKISGNTI